MADDNDFRPKLGKLGRERTRKPRSQLQALAAIARRGKVRTYARPRLAPGTLRYKGRGQSAAAVARHWAHPGRRRVWVNPQIATIGPTGTAAFAQHIAYIRRDGTDQDGTRGKLFDRSEDAVDPRQFNNRSRLDERQFRFMISPEDGAEMADLRSFTRTLMKQVERDLGRGVDWVAASHYNTAHPHVHIAVRGGRPGSDELFVSRTYLVPGLRHRAEEIVTSELGHRQAREVGADRTLALKANRFTAIDKDLEREAAQSLVDLSAPPSGLARSTRSMKARRLSHLKTLGLAKHVSGPAWRLREGWSAALREMGRRSDVVEALSRDMGHRLDIGALREFSPDASQGAVITGRLSAIVVERAPTGKHVILVESLDGTQWTAAVPEADARGLPSIGSVISVAAAATSQRERSARASPAPDSPASSSLPRLHYIVNSWLPVDQLTDRMGYTWLDQVDEASATAAAPGFGAEVRAARQVRQAWLQAAGLGSATREDLEAAEIRDVAAAESRRLGKRFVTVADREVFRGFHQGHIDTAQGRFAVIANSSRFALVPWADGQAPEYGQPADVSRGAISHQTVLAQGRGTGR